MDKFERAFEEAHEFKFDKFQFDEPDYRMLIVQDEDEYQEHLRVQAAGLAYYICIAKQAERNFEQFDRKVKFRLNEMYKDCSNRLAKDETRTGRKATVRDIEIAVQDLYGEEIASLYSHLDELKSQRDYSSAFLEGWRQKSYQLSSMTNLITAGLLTPKTTITEEDQKRSLETAREILSKRKKAKEEKEESL